MSDHGSTHVEVEVTADLIWPAGTPVTMPGEYRHVFHGLKYSDPLAEAGRFIQQAGFRASVVKGTVRVRQRTVTISPWVHVVPTEGAA